MITVIFKVIALTNVEQWTNRRTTGRRHEPKTSAEFWRMRN